MFTEKDIKLLESKGISIELANWQIDQFKKGISPISLVAPANYTKGIKTLENTDIYINKYKSANIVSTKFVPASGAASRMFKDLFEFIDENNNTDTKALELNDSISEFFKNIKKFAFYTDLDKLLIEEGGMERLVAKKEYALIINTLLKADFLGYGVLPKGLLKFHFYAGNIGRTPFEEHLVEGARYANSTNNLVNIHFTVSPEHLALFSKLKDKVVTKYEDMYRVKYNISFSVQKSSTDTIAVNLDNTPFYNSDGGIFFRPGGHGALIENLNEINSDIIFIKNIDNVVPEKKLEVTINIKKALAGLLIEIQNEVFRLCTSLRKHPTKEVIDEAKLFINNTLCLSDSCVDNSNENYSESEMLVKRLNRPIRVCGMVKNEGEPGGGPFLIENKDACISPQIVESSQVDLNNDEQAQIFSKASHFNPVDLVCAVKDFEGNKFDLKKFVDNDTCFISNKSKNGRDLKALELPGLWNGAMAGWNTIFVEVPAGTFNPVKTVNDLLRKSHQ